MHSAQGSLALGISGLVVAALWPGEGSTALMQGLLIGASLGLVYLGLQLLARRQRAVVTELSRAATTDALTGLPNRRTFQVRMEEELARAQRDRGELSLLVADLDDFKALNDRHGHLGGDMALERAAGTISRSVRAYDTAARLGGEEFAIILPGATKWQARAVAERIRAHVQHAFAGTSIPLTVSLGVATFPGDGKSTEELLGAADRAMYVAKARGKNQHALSSAAFDGPSDPRVRQPVPERLGSLQIWAVQGSNLRP
jgi:diguanylate cyclase (GGDEF)-like protein